MIAAVKKYQKRSHWQYASRYIQKDSVGYHWFRGIVNISKPSHISTAIMNADGTLSQSVFALDFDYKLATDEWKSKGKLNYDAIKAKLFEEFPFLVDYFVSACRSSSLTGFHLVFSFSPFQVGNENFKSTEDVFNSLGGCLVSACNQLGFGVDSNAWGCNRLTMNWNNPIYRIEYHHDALKRSWYGDTKLDNGRYKRENVLGDLLIAMRSHHLLKYKPKKEEWLKPDSDIIYPDIRVETKLAGLMLHVLEEENDFWTNRKELRDRFSFNPDTLKKLIGTRLPCGLLIDLHDQEICVSLDCYIDRYVDRAIMLSEGAKELKGVNLGSVDLFPPNSIPHPASLDVSVDGIKNKWIVSIAVWFKFAGFSLDRAEKILSNALPQIGGWESSSKSRDWQKRLANIYKNRPENFGILLSVNLPQWLLDFEYVKPLPVVSYGENTKKFKKVYQGEDFDARSDGFQVWRSPPFPFDDHGYEMLVEQCDFRVE